MKGKVVGIDLAGSDKNETGFCVTNGKEAFSFTVFKDWEIIRLVDFFSPNVVVIDAPLSLPRGRKSLDVDNGKHFRECDLQLRKMGIKFLPITLRGMRSLTKRGMRLSNIMGKKFKVIESYPRAAIEILNVERKKLEKIFGLKSLTEHESDALVCAVVGLMYLLGRHMVIGDREEGLMFLPTKLPLHELKILFKSFNNSG